MVLMKHAFMILTFIYANFSRDTSVVFDHWDFKNNSVKKNVLKYILEIHIHIS